MLLSKVDASNNMVKASVAAKAYHLRSLIKGFLIAACLAIFFHIGISLTYNYMPQSIILLIGLIIICSMIFRVNLKYGQYLDVHDVFSKTIALNDFKLSNSKFRILFTRYIRPSNPYIGAIAAISVLLFVLWDIPALIIYWAIYPGPYGRALTLGVFFMTAGSGILYFISNKDEFPSVTDRIIFFGGIMLGSAGAAEILV